MTTILNLQQEELGKRTINEKFRFSNISHSREKLQNIAHTLIKKLCFGTFSYVLEHLVEFS